MSELFIPGCIGRPLSPFPGREWFNPGVAYWRGKTVLAARLDRFPTTLIFAELDDAGRFARKFCPPLGDGIAEDARLIVLNDERLGVSFTNVVYAIDLETKTRTATYTLWWAELDAEYNVILQQPIPFGNRVKEKNWVPFWEHDDLWFIYSHSPWVAFAYRPQDDIVCTDAVVSQVDLCWDYGTIRGGTPPVKIGDYYYEFFHSSLDTATKCCGYKTRVYYVGCLKFNAETLLPVAMTREPIMGGSKDCAEQIEYWHGNLSAIFPSGCLWFDDSQEFLVSYGWLDKECRMARIKFKDVEDRLCPVQ